MTQFRTRPGRETASLLTPGALTAGSGPATELENASAGPKADRQGQFEDPLR